MTNSTHIHPSTGELVMCPACENGRTHSPSEWNAFHPQHGTGMRLGEGRTSDKPEEVASPPPSTDTLLVREREIIGQITRLLNELNDILARRK